MLLYKSKILEVNYLEVQYLIHLAFKPQAKNLDLGEIKKEFFLFLENRVKRRGRHFFIDFRNIEQVIDKNFINWFHSEVMPEIFSLKGNNEAIFLTQDKAKELSLPKFFIVREKLLEVKIFTDPKEAMNWLLEGQERRRLGLSGHRHDHHLNH